MLSDDQAAMQKWYADNNLPGPPADYEPQCDGLCVTGADVGIPGPGVAYPHPSCPLHSPGNVCECGIPDRCLSPTHGQVSMHEALEIRHRQNPNDPEGGELMDALGNALGLAWTIAAWYLIASVFAAPVFLVIRNARARGKRLFADEPAARVDALRHDTTHQYEQDAM